MARIEKLTEKDNKAEMALIVALHGKSRGEQRDRCVDFGVPWNEYLRLLRKWSRVIVRWEKEEGNKNKQQ